MKITLPPELEGWTVWREEFGYWSAKLGDTGFKVRTKTLSETIEAIREIGRILKSGNEGESDA